MPNILIVDDFKRDQELLASPFRSAYDVRCVGDLDEVGHLLEQWWPDVALVDAIFPRKPYAPPTFQAGSFLDLIEDKSTSYARRPQVIIVSGQNDSAKKFDEVRSWLNDGRIADVIAKSTADMGIEFFRAVVQLRVETLLDRSKWRSVQSTAESASEWFNRLGIVTRSPKILSLKRDLEAAARSNASVLLTGSTGSGKQLFAEALHALARPGKRFTHIDCATIPANLFEAEMFGIQGHGKNNTVFTSKKGILEASADGTLFLDEIQNLSHDHQQKLNRVLQERRFLPVGATADLSFRARVICASNRDLENLIRDGQFREDLYFRIGAFKIHIPSLSERVEDIPGLAEGFLDTFVRGRRAGGNRCPAIHLQPKCIDMLCGYEWKGNIRQLKNVIETAAAYAAGEDAEGMEIGPDLLARAEPGLAAGVVGACAFDALLADAQICGYRWTDLTERVLHDAIRPLLSENAASEFETLLRALQPRSRGAALGTPGRDSQDPAAIHCLKALLCVLLRPGHQLSVQEILELLQVKSWATGKKVIGVLAGELQASPTFAPFLALPSPGSHQVATLLPGILAPGNT